MSTCTILSWARDLPSRLVRTHESLSLYVIIIRAGKVHPRAFQPFVRRMRVAED